MQRCLSKCSQCKDFIVIPFRIHFCCNKCYLDYLRKSAIFVGHPWAN